ncbi:MAG TPA: hypothetical protein DCQ30_04780 [Acidimicrobiaceae bacterium]|nr:hypothetical protein [Acidimicrobiaceae bacterium]
MRRGAVFGIGMLAAALGAAGCGNGGPSGSTSSTSSSPTAVPLTSAPSTTSTSSAGAGALPANGTYADGPTGTPHTYVVLAVQPDGAVSGTVNYVYQDGTSKPEFSFTGSAGGGQAQLTSQGGGPGQFTATYSGSTFVLGGCTGYLRFVASASQCSFTLTAAPQ